MTECQIEQLFEERAIGGAPGFAITYALLRLAKAQEKTAKEINNLRFKDAATPMGAMEELARVVKNAV